MRSVFCLKCLAFLVAFTLSGCSALDNTNTLFSDTLEEIDPDKSPPRKFRAPKSRIASSKNKPRFSGASQAGTGTFVSSRAPFQESTTRQGQKGYTLNLSNAPIKEAAQSVFGEILEANYIVDPRVSGTITLQTNAPVDKAELLEIFETALALNEAAVVRQGSTYRITTANDALSSTPSLSVPSVSPNGVGTKIQVLELRHIAASEMEKILKPITRDGAIVRVDNERNHLMVAGNNAELRSIRSAISVFDIDQFRGKSVAINPLKNAKPDAVAAELKAIFGQNESSSLVRFIANERLNSVMIIASRPSVVVRAQRWIAQLDKVANTSDEQLFVYQIQNRPAKELADVLQSVLTSGSTSTETTASNRSVAPNLIAASIDSEDQPPNPISALDVNNVSPAESGIPNVVADSENNALLISTTPREYERIERILRQLDVLPLQVLLEATIAEVTLNDQLEFGLRWSIENGNFNFGLSDLANGFAGAAFPGFSAGFATSSIQVTLNALASVTDVNVISSPNLVALNNQQAVLQVGDQVPIVTQQAQGTIGGAAPVINNVELRDTGIILTVTPRVNSSGRVLLEIEQEVSSVVPTTTSGIDSPTIQQRRIATKVLVNDGESIALGGLIQENNSLTRSQIPILGDIPILGNAFKNKTDTITRTELIIFIRPSVIRNIREARDVTAEFREKLTLESAISKRRGGRNRTVQNLKRLKY